MVRRLALAASLVLLLAGCSSDDGAKNAAKEAAVSPEDRIKQIENTPGMPEDQKAAAIEQIRHPHAPGKPSGG